MFFIFLIFLIILFWLFSQKKIIKCRNNSIDNPANNILITTKNLTIPPCNENNDNINYNNFVNPHDIKNSLLERHNNYPYILTNGTYPNNRKDFNKFIINDFKYTCKQHSTNCGFTI
jgi:hypothetical protein